MSWAGLFVIVTRISKFFSNSGLWRVMEEKLWTRDGIVWFPEILDIEVSGIYLYFHLGIVEHKSRFVHWEIAEKVVSHYMNL